MTDNPLPNYEEQDNNSSVYMQPRINITQPTREQYTLKNSQYFKNYTVNPFSCSLFINLEPKDQENTCTKRKNAIVFSKNKRRNLCQTQQQISNQKVTPFRNRKDLEKKAIQKKLLEIRNKRQVADIISGNVKKWLVIQQIPTQQRSIEKLKSEPTQAITNAEKKEQNSNIEENKILKTNQKDSKQEKKIDKLNLYLKRSKKQKYWKKIQKTQHDSAVNFESSSKLRVQCFNMNTTGLISTQTSKKTNHFYSRSNFSRQKGQRQVSLNSLKLRSSSPLSQQNYKREVELRKSQLSQSALKCSKIDLKDYKCILRPQTAFTADKFLVNQTKKLKQTVRPKIGINEMTGWQDLSDSCQRQNYF